jgi:hypothetical protein
MDKTKINKGRMYHSTNLVLDKFSGSFADHAELIQAHSELKNGILLIDEEQQVQVVDNKGLTQAKVALRTELTQLILKLTMALKALGTSQKNTDLLTKTNYKLGDLNRLSDPILFDVAKMLLKLANNYRPQLVRFFFNDEDFNRTDVVIAEFKSAIPQKRLATTVSKSSTKKISEVFKSIDKLLKEVIDVYVGPFEYQNPDFYREYSNARIIVGYTGRGKRKMETKNPEE